MIRYSISYQNPLTHLVEIELTIDQITNETTQVHLPAWRPGRYELQNYAANIRGFQAFGQNHSCLPFEKTARNTWAIDTKNTTTLSVRYQYYANQMDAGGCWLDDEQLYLNFICCALYIPERINEPCEVIMNTPADYTVACGMTKNGNTLIASDFYQLVDSPLIASNSLTHLSFECQKVDFHIWIQGACWVDKTKLLGDFKKYTEVQLNMMGEFPEKDYHYLFQFLPYRHYHGVEHRNSTVITLGPDTEIANEKYKDLLGISSHELYHAWNIIKIRPKEMMPYDFSRENYFPTGFVAEGFTTYYGDLFLKRAGLLSTESYFNELNTTLKRHFDNYGNFNLSLAESSIDLWVDGYSAGIPNRKVSIYVKGCVVALLLDLEIRQLTANKKSLDAVLVELWKRFGKTGKGYSIHDVQFLLESVSGNSFETFFQECIYGRTDLKTRLEKQLSYVGCHLERTDAPTFAEHRFGLRYVMYNQKIRVEAIAPESPAETVLCKNDELISINGNPINDELLKVFEKDTVIRLEVLRYGKKKEIILSASDENFFFPEYKIIRNENASLSEKENFTKWLQN